MHRTYCLVILLKKPTVYRKKPKMIKKKRIINVSNYLSHLRLRYYAHNVCIIVEPGTTFNIPTTKILI